MAGTYLEDYGVGRRAEIWYEDYMFNTPDLRELLIGRDAPKVREPRWDSHLVMELKHDKMCLQTGNLYIEKRNTNSGRPSGLLVCEAKWFIMIAGKNEALLFDREELVADIASLEERVVGNPDLLMASGLRERSVNSGNSKGITIKLAYAKTLPSLKRIDILPSHEQLQRVTALLYTILRAGNLDSIEEYLCGGGEDYICEDY